MVTGEPGEGRVRAADAETAPMREPDLYRYEMDLAGIAEPTLVLHDVANAASAVLNTAITSSPIFFTTLPLNSETAPRTWTKQDSIACAAGLSPSFSYKEVLPVTSANNIERCSDINVMFAFRSARNCAHWGKF